MAHENMDGALIAAGAAAGAKGVLLRLALTKTKDVKQIQGMFDEY